MQIVLLYYIPPLRTRFLSYGVRDTITDDYRFKFGSNKGQDAEQQPVSNLERLMSIPFKPFLSVLDILQSIRVPHSWFKHFYVLATTSSLLWAYQIGTQGYAFRLIAGTQKTLPYQEVGSMDGIAMRTVYVQLLFFVHASRRLYESFTLDKKSTSTMWIGHWIMGLLHYFAVGAALWVDAAPVLARWEVLRVGPPSMTTMAFHVVPATGLFVLLNISQHHIHRYLYVLPSSPRVSVPDKGVFKHAISPHYGSEIGIYACLFWLSSSSFSAPNWTMLCVLCFVATNLGVSAQVSKERYAASFGDRVVAGKSLFGLPALCDRDLQPVWAASVLQKNN